MSPATRNRLENAVASGIERIDLKRVMRTEVERADFLGEQIKENFGPFECQLIRALRSWTQITFEGKFEFSLHGYFLVVGRAFQNMSM